MNSLYLQGDIILQSRIDKIGRNHDTCFYSHEKDNGWGKIICAIKESDVMIYFVYYLYSQRNVVINEL